MAIGTSAQTVDGAPDRGAASAPFLAAAVITVAAGLSVVMPLALLDAMPDVGRSNAWIVTLGVMVWAGIRLSVLCVRGEARLFDFFFWLFVYIFLGIGPTVQLRVDQPSITTPQVDPAYDMSAAVMIVVGLAMYEIGRFFAVSRERTRSEAGVPPERILAVNERRTVVLVGLSLLATTYFLVKIGPGALLGARSEAFAARTAAWPDPAVKSVVYASAVYPLLVGAGALAQVRLTGSTALWRRGAAIALAFVTLVLLYVANPIASARYSFGTVIFALAVYAGAVRTPFRVRATMVGAIVGFLFAFPLADRFRNPDGGFGAARSSFFGEYVGNGDYDSFWQIANAYTYWRDGFVEPLRQLMGSLLFWVPRAFWPNKPTDTGILLAQYKGYTFQNLSAPLWSEALVNGGLVGLVVFFAIMGYALFRMDTKLSRALSLGGTWGIVGAVFPVYMTILLRGSLLQATGVVAVSTVCVLFVRERRTRTGADGRAGPDRH